MKSGSIRPKKSLGQNFLRDGNVARKIVAAIAPRGEDVLLEIGPGEGALTAYLAGRVGHLIVVDIDDRVTARMTSLFGSKVEILHQDILEVDLGRFPRQYGKRLRVAGNIPYNITSPILFHVLNYRDVVLDLTIMMQREVARRIVAGTGSKDYGILSIFSQLFAEVEFLFDVSPGAFYPKPQVTSSVVRLKMLPAPRFPVTDEKFFRGMVRGIFGKRRKTLRNSLTYVFGKNAPDTDVVDLRRRPEDLSIEELVILANDLYNPDLHVHNQHAGR